MSLPGTARVTTTIEDTGVPVLCEVLFDADLRMIGRATWPDGYQATWAAPERCEVGGANALLMAYAPRVIGQLVASRETAVILPKEDGADDD